MKPDFRDSVVYQIYCLNPIITDVYVGSTTNFTVRKNNHKSACNKSSSKNHHLHLYKFIRDNGGWENWNMVIIKKYTNLTERYQLLKKERKWINKKNPTLNKKLPIGKPPKHPQSALEVYLSTLNQDMTLEQVNEAKRQFEINESYENHGHIVSLSERVKEHNKRYG
jgi:hypothetical protein